MSACGLLHQATETIYVKELVISKVFQEAKCSELA